MRKAIKYPDSQILTKGLNYISGNASNNRRISEILHIEQKSFCAYTDEFISRITDEGDIDHFNPLLKGTDGDGYQNWLLVKAKWNKKKNSKWGNFQPILHPTAEDFEERIVYQEGDYFVKSDGDTEAQNLVRLLQLDDPALADKRKRYIKRKRDEIKAFGQDEIAFFTLLINDDNCQVSYPRAIKEEFGIDILQLL